ncbi:STAS domain-containing protein [Peribacillus alkalitolerans]|uniref:STAS domain-containing protein n=1 Tax=Peribacillus alkalitolerans TaxID=1550385 RepID=UPI0013D72F4E|nr:STAS domain-containing protein [Peribacillus alkalitolerans]
MSIGNLPNNLLLENVLEVIDESILVADLEFRLVWMNSTAIQTLGPLMKLFGIKDGENILGKHMDFFHKNPHHQHRIMESLSHSHRTRISIKDQYYAETVITPIFDPQKIKQGYLMMLVDVTEKAQEEKEREKMIDLLSTPIMKLWDYVLAAPIVGILNDDRAERLTHTVLQNCVKERAEFFLLDVSSLNEIDTNTGHYINKICQTLRLIGTKCYIVGVSPQLAQSISNHHYQWKTFSHVQNALIEVLPFSDKIIEEQNT